MDKSCTKYGSPHNGGEKFCGNCGAPLDNPAVPQPETRNSATEQSRTIPDSASYQSKRRNYAATPQKPQKAFHSGIHFALFLTIFLFVCEIYNELVIVKPPFSDQEFFMLRYPLLFDISDFLTIFVIAWLGWSIPMYFVMQKNYAKIQTDEQEKKMRLQFFKIRLKNWRGR